MVSLQLSLNLGDSGLAPVSQEGLDGAEAALTGRTGFWLPEKGKGTARAGRLLVCF